MATVRVPSERGPGQEALGRDPSRSSPDPLTHHLARGVGVLLAVPAFELAQGLARWTARLTVLDRTRWHVCGMDDTVPGQLHHRLI